MTTLKIIVNTGILATATAICFIISSSALHLGMSMAVTDALVAGISPETYGVQFDTQGHVEDLSEPPQVNPTSWNIPDFHLQSTERYIQPTVSDAYMQWGAK